MISVAGRRAPRWCRLHAAGVTLLLRHHEPVMGDREAAIVVDLAPFVTRRRGRNRTSRRAGQQIVQQPPPSRRRAEAGKRSQDRAPAAAGRKAEVTAAEASPSAKPVPQPSAEPNRAAAPARRQRGRGDGLNDQHRKQNRQHKGYPPSALPRRESGVTQVAFAIDRDGRLLRADRPRLRHARADQEASTLCGARSLPAATRWPAGREVRVHGAVVHCQVPGR